MSSLGYLGMDAKSKVSETVEGGDQRTHGPEQASGPIVAFPGFEAGQMMFFNLSVHHVIFIAAVKALTGYPSF